MPFTLDAYEALKKENELLKAENELLQQEADSTIWRLTEADFMAIKYADIEDHKYFELVPNEEDKKLFDLAKGRFNIEDWSDYVSIFIDLES